MKYFSEILNAVFDTPEELNEKEAAYQKEAEEKEKLNKEAEEKEKLNKEKEARRKEVEDAFNAVIEAKKNADAKLNAYIKDYGEFHGSFKERIPSYLDILFDPRLF